jgi:hypothetical protein
MTERLRGAAALEALEAAGKLWATPAQTADVLERDLKATYLALERGEIPSNRIGQRYNVPVAWLRRQADGVTA